MHAHTHKSHFLLQCLGCEIPCLGKTCSNLLEKCSICLLFPEIEKTSEMFQKDYIWSIYVVLFLPSTALQIYWTIVLLSLSGRCEVRICYCRGKQAVNCFISEMVIIYKINNKTQLSLIKSWFLLLKSHYFICDFF